VETRNNSSGPPVASSFIQGAAIRASHLDGRAFLAVAFDALALAASWIGVAYILANGAMPAAQSDLLLTSLLVAVPLQVTASYLFGVYQGLWRYTSLPDVQRIVFSVLSGTVAVSVALRMLGLDGDLGAREYLLYPVLLIVIMSGARMFYRSFKEWSLYGRGPEQGLPVVVLGAGDAAVSLLKELSRSPDWRVVGLLDDDGTKSGRLL